MDTLLMALSVIGAVYGASRFMERSGIYKATSRPLTHRIPPQFRDKDVMFDIALQRYIVDGEIVPREQVELGRDAKGCLLYTSDAADE